MPSMDTTEVVGAMFVCAIVDENSKIVGSIRRKASIVMTCTLWATTRGYNTDYIDLGRPGTRVVPFMRTDGTGVLAASTLYSEVSSRKYMPGSRSKIFPGSSID
jgi:hypothetical protein